MATTIKDYVTGKELRLTPEEAVHREFEHILLDELGYPPSNMAIEFPIQRGSRARSGAADIIVFGDSRHNQKDAYIVIETESPGHSFDDQVFGRGGLLRAIATPSNK